ncbi:hypothetical protein B0T10DRAFT_560628 [Thelonectria olida]|uniref:Uncharacterized protein n=1 Tax=Thelonectria olida TaxID=1576542 RepID=A0A9P9ATR6_9HYPO|nr:hypothetical protein B0T10DRAFT_560628 [Thelonectria olida]
MKFRRPAQQVVAILFFVGCCWFLAQNFLVATKISCPNPNEDVLVCGLGDCEPSTSVNEADFLICAGKFRGCECVPPAVKIPPPSWPTSNSLHCSTRRHEPGVDTAHLLEHVSEFSQQYEYLGGLGDLWRTYPSKPERRWLSRAPQVDYVELSWRNRRDVNCEKDEKQIFWDLFNSPDCRPDNRTLSINGTLSTPCGDASYKLVSYDWPNVEPARSKELSPMKKTDWEHGGGSFYDGFCSQWKPGSALTKTIDFNGQELHPRRSLYLEQNVDLKYRPKYYEGQCDTTCTEAMHILKASFDENWTQEDAAASYMAKSAGYETRCGHFSYRIRDQKEDLVMLAAKCHGSRMMGYPQRTPYETRDELVRAVSERVTGQTLHEGEEKIVYASDTLVPDTALVVVARWEKNCKLETGETQMRLDTPIPGERVTTCEEVLQETYRCPNLLGVSIQVGCTVWEVRKVLKKG